MLFYYLGDDEVYFRALQGEFSRSTRLALSLTRLFETEERKIQSLFLKVVKHRPAVVFIDFSKNSQDYLHLARILTRTPTEHPFVTVGLVDYLSPQEILLESIATGVNLTHIKSTETFDVIFDVVRLVAPNELGEHGFANAATKEDWEAGVPVKIGYVGATGLHMETDLLLNKGDRIRMNHAWAQRKTIPSRDFFVQEVSNKNLFYHFKYAVDADFVFVDEFVTPEGMEPDRIEEKKKEREDSLALHKKQHKKWVEDNVSQSQEKKAKVLVVDPEFHFYNDQPRTDTHAYTIRCVPFLKEIETELDRLEPQVIAFALDPEGTTAPKNTPEELLKLTTALRAKFGNELPFLIIFNCKTPSKELQANFNYPQLMSSDGELSVGLLMRMAEIFDKKMSENLEKLKAKGQGPKRESRVFLKKTNMDSIAEVVIPVTVIKLSETDMIIQTDRELPVGTNLHLTQPVNMYVNLQATKAPSSKVPEYHGLIHCMGEEQKKELRKFINLVFFRDHDAQVTAETEEFKKLNEAKLQEKQEALKKLQEEAQKKAEEEGGGAPPVAEVKSGT